MECLTIKTKERGQASVAAYPPPGEARKETTPVKMVLCSRTAGRERWHIHELENRPRLAASLELVLGSEKGVGCVQANPLTGRVLVHYRPDLISELVENLILRALEFGPMTPQEYAARPKPPAGWSAGHFVAGEIACTALKTTLFGGCCWLTLGAAALLLLHRRHA